MQMHNILNYLVESQRHNYIQLIQSVQLFPLKGLQFPVSCVQTGFYFFCLQKDKLWTNKIL